MNWLAAYIICSIVIIAGVLTAFVIGMKTRSESWYAKGYEDGVQYVRNEPDYKSFLLWKAQTLGYVEISYKGDGTNK